MSERPPDLGSPDAADEVHVQLPTSSFWRDLIWATPSWLLSMIVHVILLLTLAMLYLPASALDDVRELLLATGEEEVLEQLEDLSPEPIEPVEAMEGLSADDLVLDSVIAPEEVAMSSLDTPTTDVHFELSDFELDQGPVIDLAATVGAISGDAFAGRSENRELLVRRDGGNDASEKAVSLALVWLAAHQMPDGGWNFDHALCPSCGGRCGNPGSLRRARNGATAMALLPFLGAGQTHRDGQYKEVVRAGLYFLKGRMQFSRDKGGSLHEPGGNMYSHGLAAIALCEAYAMTKDKSLHPLAQASINYIVYAQDRVGGGWRYTAHEPGDTSVVGWQVMALKSALMGYLYIPGQTVLGAKRFLDSVQAKNGARYGYLTPAGNRATTTAVGLLCRMHLGWDHDHPALIEGVKFLSSEGPSSSDMYYNYYATQVMRHYGGPMWKEWNAKMRDQLVRSQAKEGHEKGSWHISNSHGGKGGRLYDTSMATMILEVYYRHLPIYRKQSTETEFSLD